jgi:hypothetical protein
MGQESRVVTGHHPFEYGFVVLLSMPSRPRCHRHRRWPVVSSSCCVVAVIAIAPSRRRRRVIVAVVVVVLSMLLSNEKRK